MKWMFPQDPPSQDQVAAIEKEWNVSFPETYRVALQEGHGGTPAVQAVRIGKHTSMVNNFFRIIPCPKKPSRVHVRQALAMVQSRVPARVFPFARDPGGNLFCFDFRSDSKPPSVVFWDNERASERDPAAGILPICDSFEEFLSRLS